MNDLTPKDNSIEPNPQSRFIDNFLSAHLNPPNFDRFSQKWRDVLSQVDDYESYSEEAALYGWQRLETKELPREAQWDIDLKKTPIITENVVLLNHPYCPAIKFGDRSSSAIADHDLVYLGNLAQLFKAIDRTKSQVVVFDYPEHYVLSSRQMLERGEVSSVILTPYTLGGSLLRNQAQQELKNVKNIYIAGAYFPCIAATAEELIKNGHRVSLIGDVVHSGYIKDPELTLGTHRQSEWADEGVSGVEMIDKAEFLQRSASWKSNP
jgi:hypothetical protein